MQDSHMQWAVMPEAIEKKLLGAFILALVSG